MNAEEAARAIGCSSRTVLRHVAKGTITATHKHAQELSIAADQVEKLRQILVTGTKSGQSTDTSQQIENLTARVAELEQRVRTLESGLVTSQEAPTVQATSPPVLTLPYVETLPIEKPQIGKVATEGTLSASEFAAQHGLSYEDFKNYMRRGVNGERLDITEVPHHTRKGYTNKYLTVEQQEKALELLRRHGKLARLKTKKLITPEGSLPADTFADRHGVDRSSFHEHMTQGRGPGLIGKSTDVIPERDRVAHESRPKPGRGHTGEVERYLTELQQAGAIQFWHRHDVDFAECDQPDCTCHTKGE